LRAVASRRGRASGRGAPWKTAHIGQDRIAARFQLADDAEAAIRLEDHGPGLAQAGDAAAAEGGEEFSLRDAGLSLAACCILPS